MNSYYHTLGSGNSTPLDLLINMISVQELQLVSGEVVLVVYQVAPDTGGLGTD